jgi:hypothetical protein
VLLGNFLYFSERGSAGRARGCRAGARTDRNLADAHLALARFLSTIDWNVDTAELEVNQALELNPRNPQALRVASELASTRGQTDRALDFASKAIVNDPLGSRDFTRIAAAEIGKGNLESNRILGGAMQRKMTGQHRDSSRLLIPRQISSFYVHLTIDLTPLCGAHPQDPVTLHKANVNMGAPRVASPPIGCCSYRIVARSPGKSQRRYIGVAAATALNAGRKE